jgi:hypothetical protein
MSESVASAMQTAAVLRGAEATTQTRRSVDVHLQVCENGVYVRWFSGGQYRDQVFAEIGSAREWIHDCLLEFPQA